MGEWEHAIGERLVCRGGKQGGLGRCVCVCVSLCGGIERLPSTLLCKLTGLDVQLTGLFWQVSDGPYYNFTGGPLGPCITGHSPTAQLEKKIK